MNLTDPLARHARERPHQLAVLDGDRHLDFATLERLTAQVATGLRAAGVLPDQRVAVLLRDPLVLLVTLLALARLGAAQVTLRLGDSDEGRARLAARSGATLLIAHPSRTGGVPLPLLPLATPWLSAGAAPVDPAARAEGDGRTWAIMTSSGTTGEPKLFSISHRGLCRRAARFVPAAGLGIGARIMSLVGMGFPTGQHVVIVALAHGLTVVMEPSAGALEPRRLLAMIEQHQIELLWATPLHASQLLELCPPDGPRLPGLKALCIGSSFLPDQQRAVIRRRLTPGLVIVYGCNELGTMSLADAALQQRHASTLGRPLEDLRFEVVDPEGRPLPPGEIGVMRVHGAEPVRYLDGPPPTAGDWFDLPDLGAMTEDGALIFHGRADDMINCDGIKISPIEIETALLAHPAVVEAAAFPVPSPRLQQLPAVAVVTRDPSLGAAALLAFAQARLRHHSPHRLLIVPKLPRNPMGKVLRRELAAMVEAQLDRA